MSDLFLVLRFVSRRALLYLLIGKGGVVSWVFKNGIVVDIQDVSAYAV